MRIYVESIDKYYIAFMITFRVTKIIVMGVAIGVVIGFANNTIGANLIAHWKLDEASAPYADSWSSFIQLLQDTNTTVAISGAGIAGSAAQVNWHNPPGIATRLYATNAVLQTDSFGFSFWFNPNYLNQNDALIAKEMAYNGTASNRISWQVHIGNINAHANEPIELAVYGDNRSLGSFYGNVLSVTNIPLHLSMPDWIHVAGGYDSKSGALSLFVNGIQAASTNSMPGANNSDGSPFDIGSGKNGNDFVIFSAGTYIDDVQLYDGPLTASEVSVLIGNPGQTVNAFLITGIQYLKTNEDSTITFNSTAGMAYKIEISTNLTSFTVVDNVTAVGCTTSVSIPNAYIDQILGTLPISQLFYRVQQLPGTTAFGSCN